MSVGQMGRASRTDVREAGQSIGHYSVLGSVCWRGPGASGFCLSSPSRVSLSYSPTPRLSHTWSLEGSVVRT